MSDYFYSLGMVLANEVPLYWRYFAGDIANEENQ